MEAYRLAGWKQGGHYVDVDKPKAGAGEVLIRMGGAGICHSDLHLMHEWSPEAMPQLARMSPDFTLGHENAGWIEALGPGVQGWQIGQAVVLSLVWSCGRCAACRAGDDAYCEGPRNMSGGLGRDGGLASHMVAPARSLVALIVGRAVPLQPLHILWINTITAALLGLTLAFEPKEPDLMRLRPRDPDEPLIAQGMMKYILVVGLLLIWSVYFVFERALLRFDDFALAQTAAVNAIVFGEIFYLFNVRSFRHTLREIGFFSNKRLLGSVIIMIVLQILFTNAGFMNRIFGTSPLGLGAWLYIITISFIIFLVVEFMKWYDRRQARKRSN